MAANRKKSNTSARGTAKKPAPAAKSGRRAASGTDPRFSILLFGIGLFFILLCFVNGAPAWEWIRQNILFGGFGISAWLIGPLFIYWAVLVGMKKKVAGEIIRGVLLMMALSSTMLIFGKLSFGGFSLKEKIGLLIESGQTKTGGGLISIIFGWTILELMGRPAANFVIIIIALVILMIFTGVTPADVAAFVKKVIFKISGGVKEQKRRFEEDYYDDEDFIDEYEEIKEPDILPSSMRRKRADIDVKIGDTSLSSQPGPGETEDVVIGPGGTFGMNPLDVPLSKEEENQRVAAMAEAFRQQEDILRPFDINSKQSLFDNSQKEPEILLFGDDDPYNNPSKIARGKFDVEYIPPPVNGNIADNGLFGEKAGLAGENASLEPLPKNNENPLAAFMAGKSPQETVESGANGAGGIDLFAQQGAVGASGPSEPLKAEKAGESDLSALAENKPGEVEALIDKAAAEKPGQNETATDNRGKGIVQPYPYPPINLFEKSPPDDTSGARDEMKKTAELLVGTLSSFGVQTRILDVCRGPSVTRYEIQPQTGVKISRITNLADDIALNLATAGVRIEAPIPGKPAVGIEVPNKIKSMVSIRTILENNVFALSTSPLTIALGKDIAGDSVVADLTKMPHLLIAGSTGSGKSVCVNSIIMSLLYKSGPDEVKLLLIDPKVVELAEYNGIPHLLMPVVTEARKAAGALGAMVAEMEKRYHLFAEYSVRDIKSFNKLAEKQGMDKMPYIAIVIDELADLMMVAGKEVEDYICRIAQKARAAGMHLIVATQRPSVDVITGLIKANIPSRIAFAVSSQIDSRTILDGGGAEKLLGMGDMLFMPVGANKPVRVQGTYVKDKEISSVIRFIKGRTESEYDEALMDEMERRAKPDSEASADGGLDDLFGDETFCAAVDIAFENDSISTSFLQRRMRLGYARAGRIVDQMEQLGIVGPPNGSKPRELLITRQQWLEMSMNATG